MNLDFSGVKILVLGDPIQDIYLFGRVERMSPEAPVPVFIQERYESRYGGAANVAYQLEALGCGMTFGWSKDGEFPWTTKTRYMVGSHQLLRVDEDLCVPNRLPALEGFSAIVISDYAKGACTPELCQEAIASGLPVIVDPKGKDWSKYQGCAVITPNSSELHAHNYHVGKMGRILHKAGADGLYLHLCGTPESSREHFPAQARHVFDQTGAGDTVTAVIAACVAAKIPLPEACKLANLAAGYVVGEVGTTVCPIEKLRELCA